MKRQIITIDKEKCTGCGLCIVDCPEGALQIINGKAQLVSENFCDGLGACMSTCPENAIRIEEREAEEYHENQVMKNIVPQGQETILAHLKHLHSHGDSIHLNEAIDYLKKNNLPVPDYKNEGQGCHHTIHACPGSGAMDLRKKNSTSTNHDNVSISSELQQWPVQLKLLNPAAQYFESSDILIAADCTAFAYGNFHKEFLKDKIVIILCPKLDPYREEYIDKLAAILSMHTIKSITVARMEVPCCGGVNMLLEQAIEKSGKNFKVKEYIISIKGDVITGF